MSDVEKFYAAIVAKWPNPCKPWSELHPNEQMQFMTGLNLMLAVLE
jgi:hypothetical protein